MVNVSAVAGTAAQGRDVIERSEQADGSSPLSDQALLAVAQGQRTLLLFSLDDAEAGASASPVAVGVIGQGELDLVVDPAFRGRGVGTAALQRLLGEAPAGEYAHLLAWAHGDNPAADALLAGTRFEPMRSLFRMTLDPALLPADGIDPLALEVPEGFTLRTFAARDAEAWVAVNAIAFASHPEQGRVTLADFDLMRQEPWFDAEDLFVLDAPDASRLAGYTWVKTLQTPSGVECELYAIGMDPEFAGQGLGRTLLDVTLARMAQHAPVRVTLYVDGENERAVRMYEAAGFAVDSRSRQWRGSGAPQVSE